MNFFIGGTNNVNLREDLDFNGVNNIYISSKSAKINIVKGGEGEATLTGVSFRKNEQIFVEKIGDTLKLEVQKDVRRVGIAKLEFDIVVPDNVYDSLTVKNISGRTEVLGIDAKEIDISNISGSIYIDGENNKIDKLDISSVSGSVKIENIDSDGEVNLKSTSGSIQMDGLKFKSLEANSISGSVKGYDVNGDMQIKNISGSITIEGKLGEGSNMFKTTSGSIRVLIDNAPKYMDLSSTSGKVTFNETDGYNVQHKSNKGFRGEYGEALADSSLNADSTSGSITVELR